MITLLRRILCPAPTHASRRTPHRFRRSHQLIALPRRRLRGNRLPPLLASSLASTSDLRLLFPLLTHSLGPIPGPSSAPPNSTMNSTAHARSSSPSSRPSPLRAPLLRAALYFYCEFRKLGKAFHVYTLMRPAADTYHALLSRGGNDTMVHYMYMDTVSALFRQMLEEGIPPDTRSVNVLVRGYAQALHLNDALRVFHQMVPHYGCEPDASTYSYLVHGLSAQGRTKNARELFEEMRAKGMVPTEPSCNAFVSALAVAGEVTEAERVMWEMARAGTVVDRITRRAVVEELGRAGKREDADRVVRKMEEMGILRVAERRELLGSVRDECGDGGFDVDESMRGGDRRRQSS